MSSVLPRKGVYALVVHVSRKFEVRVGGLGRREFCAGLYVYTGSALNSLPGRLLRHLSREKRIWWHIDHLLDSSNSSIVGVGWKDTSREIECAIARGIASQSERAIDGFGCGDCRCHSHLHYFSDIERARTALSEAGLHFSKVSRGKIGVELTDKNRIF